MPFVSQGFFQERVVRNGKMVENINAKSMAASGNNGKVNYLIEGNKNNKKFRFTNMRSKKRRAKKAKRRTNKK
jgi:hypothetical protein